MFLPWFATTEVVTMKITSSTRNTSVSGVMLISATTPSSGFSSSSGRNEAMAHLRTRRRTVVARRRLEEQERLPEPLARARVGARDQADARLEIVEEQQRDDRHREAGRGRDQRLGDARGHDLEAARAVLRHVG